MKSGIVFGSGGPSSDHVRKPNCLMRSLSRFSATGEGCGGALDWSASRTAMRTEIFGSPLARMKSMRSSRDIWLRDFCSARTLTTPCVCIDTSPSLPMRGALSEVTVETKVPLCISSLSRTIA
jgi:hypothetical protein